MVAAPTCGLYLVLPAKLPQLSDNEIAEVLAQSRPACLLLSDDGGRDERPRDPRFREITAAQDIALLVETDIARAELIGADGVHISADAALYGRARERLGARAIVGVDCAENRHDAMVAAELGADYVAFGNAAAAEEAQDRLAELIAWWSEIFVVPCVALAVETPQSATKLAGLGADFIAVSPTVWNVDGTIERIGAIGAALRLGRSAT